MIEFVQRFWIETACALTFGGLSFIVRYLWVKTRAINRGVLAMLHDRIFQSCKYFIDKKSIGLDELKNIEYLYNAYHDLGGNSTGTEIYNRVKNLPLE